MSALTYKCIELYAGPRDGELLTVDADTYHLSFDLYVGSGHTPDKRARKETHHYKLSSEVINNHERFRWCGFCYELFSQK